MPEPATFTPPGLDTFPAWQLTVIGIGLLVLDGPWYVQTSYLLYATASAWTLRSPRG